MRGSRILLVVLAVLATALGTTVVSAGAQSKTATDEVGVTAKELHVAVIADVDTPVQPGLFQQSVDAMRAWAKVVNQSGGIAGRKVVIDFIDSKLNPTETRNAIITACANDFAMVGGEALFMSNVEDMVACKDASGAATGLPDVPGLALDTNESCSPVTYVIIGLGPYCATRTENPQTYVAPQGDYRWYLSQNKDLHGVFVLPADLKSTRNALIPSFTAGVDLGIKKDGAGFYDAFQRDPQSAMTPIVQVIKQNNSTFAYTGSNKMVDLRKEATLQGVTSVKVWGCTQACYSQPFIDQGGSDVEGTSAYITTLPFYSEYTKNPTLQKLVKAVGGIDKVDSNAVASWTAALLFQDAVQKAAAGSTLSRKTLLDELAKETKFTAQGIIGPTDVAHHLPPNCIVITKLTNGKFVRVHPTKVGTFDCSPKNRRVMQLNLS